MSKLKSETNLNQTKSMLKLFGFIDSIFLIGIIFLRMPNMGLTSFATTSSLLGSPSSAERSLNILTAFGILIYLGIAIKLNLLKN